MCKDYSVKRVKNGKPELDKRGKQIVDGYSCACVKVDFNKWPKPVAARFADATGRNGSNRYRYNFNGKIKMYKECMDSILKRDSSVAPCMEQMKAGKKMSKQQQAECQSKGVAQKQYMEMMKAFEVNLNCQGICTPSHFWWFRSIETGPPKQGCLLGIKREFNNTSGVAAIVMIVAVCVAICLCCCTCMLCPCFSKKK